MFDAWNLMMDRMLRSLALRSYPARMLRPGAIDDEDDEDDDNTGEPHD
jgi:hypothetical protein